MRSAVIITTSADGKTSAEHFPRAEDGKQAFRKLSGVTAELWLSDAGRTKRLKSKSSLAVGAPAPADEATFVLEKGEPVLTPAEVGEADEAAAFLADTPAEVPAPASDEALLKSIYQASQGGALNFDAPVAQEVASEAPAPAPVEVAQEVPAEAPAPAADEAAKPKRKGKKAAEAAE